MLSWTIGTILLFDMDAPDRAIPYLQQAVSLAPRSKQASLDLCHALLGTKQSDRALFEAKRFLSLMDSEEHSRLLVAMGRAPERTTAQGPESGVIRTEGSAADCEDAQNTKPAAAEPRHLIVVLVVETSRISGGEPYRFVQAGIAKIIGRLRTTKGALERLYLHLVTFAGRVVSIMEFNGAIDDAGVRSRIAGGLSDVKLERSGLISALEFGTEAISAAFADLHSRQVRYFLPWIVMLTGGEVDAERKRLLVEAQRILSPLRKDPGLNLIPILIGRHGNQAVLAELGGPGPRLRLRDEAVDEFFDWLAKCLDIIVRQGAPGTKIRLPEPSWGTAV